MGSHTYTYSQACYIFPGTVPIPHYLLSSHRWCLSSKTAKLYHPPLISLLCSFICVILCDLYCVFGSLNTFTVDWNTLVQGVLRAHHRLGSSWGSLFPLENQDNQMQSMGTVCSLLKSSYVCWLSPALCKGRPCSWLVWAAAGQAHAQDGHRSHCKPRDQCPLG